MRQIFYISCDDPIICEFINKLLDDHSPPSTVSPKIKNNPQIRNSDKTPSFLFHIKCPFLATNAIAERDASKKNMVYILIIENDNSTSITKIDNFIESNHDPKTLSI
jgi:hypothetical protein